MPTLRFQNMFYYLLSLVHYFTREYIHIRNRENQKKKPGKATPNKYGEHVSISLAKIKLTFPPFVCMVISEAHLSEGRGHGKRSFEKFGRNS